MPRQDEHLPDQIEAYVHQAGLEVQRRSQVLIGEIRCQFIILARKDEPTRDYAKRREEIRCQFIILARKDEPTRDYAKR